MKREGDEAMEPDIQRVQDAVRALPRIEAAPAYTARLRRDFLAGALDTPRLVTVRRAHRRGWRAALPWILVPTAAASLLILYLSLQGPAWTTLSSRGEGGLRVDGKSLLASDKATLERLVREGVRVETGTDAGIEVACGDLLILEIVPESDVTLPERPGRRLRRTLHGQMRMGEIRIMTGPGFPGYGLEVRTPEGRIELAGTIISVFRNEDLTCVCVLEGEAIIGEHLESMEPIGEGMRKVMFRDRRPEMVTEIATEHLHGLLDFRERHRERFGESVP